jgi:hypothetical protein
MSPLVDDPPTIGFAGMTPGFPSVDEPKTKDDWPVFRP